MKKYIVYSANDTRMTEKDYASNPLIKLYKHYEENYNNGYNSEVFVYYTEIELIEDIFKLANHYKFIVRNDVCNYDISEVLSDEDFAEEFAGSIVIYDYYVE